APALSATAGLSAVDVAGAGVGFDAEGVIVAVGALGTNAGAVAVVVFAGATAFSVVGAFGAGVVTGRGSGDFGVARGAEPAARTLISNGAFGSDGGGPPGAGAVVVLGVGASAGAAAAWGFAGTGESPPSPIVAAWRLALRAGD